MPTRHLVFVPLVLSTMGGEWSFEFIGDWLYRLICQLRRSDFPLTRYQHLLHEIKQEYKPIIPNPEERFDVKVFWFEATDSQLEPADNIFATFESNDTQPYRNKKYIWKLYWNPLAIGTPERKNQCNLHARGPYYYFQAISIKIQKMLTTEFSDHFQLYLSDGPSGQGPECNEYFGVLPDGYVSKKNADDQNQKSGNYKVLNPTHGWMDHYDTDCQSDDAVSDEELHGYESRDLSPCSSDCGCCETLPSRQFDRYLKRM